MNGFRLTYALGSYYSCKAEGKLDSVCAFLHVQICKRSFEV